MFEPADGLPFAMCRLSIEISKLEAHFSIQPAAIAVASVSRTANHHVIHGCSVVWNPQIQLLENFIYTRMTRLRDNDLSFNIRPRAVAMMKNWYSALSKMMCRTVLNLPLPSQLFPSRLAFATKEYDQRSELAFEQTQAR